MLLHEAGGIWGGAGLRSERLLKDGVDRFISFCAA